MRWSKRNLLAYLDRVEPALDGLSHFELLDIAGDATTTHVQDAFHQMASRLHPDLYRTELTPEDFERLTRVYARIAEAYRALRSDDERKRYLMTIARKHEQQQAPATGGDPIALLQPKARRLYRRAQTSLQRGDRASALLSLRMAAALEPKSALLREALALFADDDR